MITAAWYLAIFINNNGVWKTTVERSESESMCLQQARGKWRKYWQEGHDDESKMQLRCYDDDQTKEYWVHCTKYDSCSIKG